MKNQDKPSLSELEKRLEGMTPIEQIREVFSELRELEKAIEELGKRISSIESKAKGKDS